MSPQKPKQTHLGLISLLVVVALASSAAGKRVKCQTEDECQMKPEHFRVYSEVRQAVDQDFAIKGKDLISLVRSVEVLRRRFQPAAAGGAQLGQANGTALVLALLNSQKLRNALEVFVSDEGRQLVNLYKTSINGNQQNLACSKWRVDEIEFAAKKLERDEKLAEVFANIHKNFVERSARKCLKTSCSSIEDNMNRLDAILRRSHRRKGFLVHSLPFEMTTEMTGVSTSLANNNSSGSSSDSTTMEETSSSPMEEALIAQLINEPVNEFQIEELELCRFFKRTNSTSCQVSGNELGEISFARPANETASSPGKLADLLADYEANRAQEPGEAGRRPASDIILAQCGAIKPVLDYHMFGLRWYQRQGIISAERLRKRVFWCPSLTYWFEVDRLCGELKAFVEGAAKSSAGSETFAY